MEKEILLRELEDRYFPSLRQFVLLGAPISREDTEDLLQETMVKVSLHGHRIMDQSNLRAWLFKVCRNLLINHIQRRKTAPGDWEEHKDIFPGHYLEPEEAIMKRELQEFVEGVLGKCTFRERQAAFLYYYEGMKIPRVAQAMEVAPGTVKSMIHRVRCKLKECWYEEME